MASVFASILLSLFLICCLSKWLVEATFPLNLGKTADGYWDHWYYIYPANLLGDIFKAYQKPRPCRQWNMQLCLPWAPHGLDLQPWVAVIWRRFALYGRLNVFVYFLFYGGLGFVPAWALLQIPVIQEKLCRPVQVLLVCTFCCLPWGLVALRWETKHGHVCWNPPHFGCHKWGFDLDQHSRIVGVTQSAVRRVSKSQSRLGLLLGVSFMVVLEH